MENELSAASIARNLTTRFVGQRVVYYPSLTSTMDVARREALRGVAEGTVIVASEQTAGRGRIKRAWLSPEGSVALSIILYPGLADMPSLMMLAPLAVARCVDGVTGLKPQLKWPNDVLIKGRKIAGILIESSLRRKIVDYTIIGIGININIKMADYPEISGFATSLSDALGKRVSPLVIVRRLLVEIEGLYRLLPDGDLIYQEWRDSLVTLGKQVRVKSGSNIYEGIAESVARDGSLLLRQPDGQLTPIVAGDATLRA